jgi:hypothetical protein
MHSKLFLDLPTVPWALSSHLLSYRLCTSCALTSDLYFTQPPDLVFATVLLPVRTHERWHIMKYRRKRARFFVQPRSRCLTPCVLCQGVRALWGGKPSQKPVQGKMPRLAPQKVSTFFICNGIY